MTKQATWILLLVPAACVAMAFIESFLSPGYALKIVLRILLFGGSMLVYLRRFPGEELKSLFSSASLIPALILAAGSFLLLLGGFFLLREFIDLEQIADGLTDSQNISRDNFLAVALYVCTLNSFLEELFFRCFSFLILRRHWDPCSAQVFSAVAFALYHVSILSGWFPWWLFALIVAGLFLCGMLFNDLDKKGSLWPSWLLHAAANVAINIIGLMMFRLI